MKQATYQSILKIGLKPTPWTIGPHSGIIFKITEDKRPGVVKVIIKHISQTKRLPTSATVAFVRDGYLIKKAPAKYQHLMRLLGAKNPIHSKNLGELFKKYEVPKSLRSIFLKSNDIHTLCISLVNVRKLLPAVEDQVKFYSSTTVYANRFHPKRFNRVFEFLNNTPFNRRLEQMNYDHLSDTIRMVNFVKTRGVEVDYSMRAEALHRWASGEYNKVINPNSVIPYTDEMMDNVGNIQSTLKANGLSIRLASDTYELVRWGNELYHCIGTYGRRAVEGSSVLFGIFVGEQLTYTIESNKELHIRQFYGKRNSRPSVDHDALVRKAFKDCSLRSLASV